MGTTKTLSRKKSKRPPIAEPLVPMRDTRNIDSRRKASNAIESLFGNMLSRIKIEAKEAIDNEKARADKAEQLTVKVKAQAEQTLAEVKTKAKEKEKNYKAIIDRLKAERKDKQKGYARKIAKTKAQGQETIVNIKAKHKEHIKTLKAESEESLAQVKTEAEESLAQVKTEAKEAMAEQEAKIDEAEQRVATTYDDGEKAVAQVKTEAKEAMAEQKAKVDEAEQRIAKTQTDGEEAIAEVKAEHDQQIAKIKAEYEQRIAKMGTEAEEQIAKVMTQAEEQIAKIKVEYEDLVAKLRTEAELASGSVSQAIREMVDSPAVLPGQQSLAVLDLCAKDIMQAGVVWAGPDETIQNALATMQRCTTEYVLVGDGTTLTGIVSKADLSASLSPYLRPAFAKWRRPLDDATLQIKLKWVMRRPVQTISPKMSLTAIIKNMCRCRVKCLPVADKQGKIHGLVAEINIFKALLKVKETAQADSPDETLLEETPAAIPSSPEQTPPQKDSENLTVPPSAAL